MSNPLQEISTHIQQLQTATNSGFLEVWNAIHWSIALNLANLLLVLAAFLRINRAARGK